jgi:other hect domain ubiquitin protein ligase E3
MGEGLLMNIGSYLSLYRDLWMTPIRVDLAQNVLHKTAVERTNVPKVKLERLKLNSKHQYAFIKAFEQIQDVHASQLRPVKPKGTDPFISFEVIFQGEDVMGETGPYR